jgi:flagellum-specific peptidoglycan hydrolase FlgJ
MADNLNPEQIDELNQRLADLVETLGGVSATTGSFGSANKEAALKTKLTFQGLDKLGASAIGLGKAMYKGEKGAGVFGDAVEEAAGAVSLLVLALGPFSLAAKVAAIAITAFAKGLNAAAKQGDALYKTYQDLQKSGATAADGIDGVFNNMQKFGYGIEELDKMTRLVSENSESLAKFSLTAADGTSAFASSMQDLNRDKGLKVLGKMPDEINAAGAAYIKQAVAAGLSQKQIGDNLGASTKQYIMDLDRLQRLTGTSADALQKQQDEALSEDAYNDVMSELKARAESGDAAATAQIQKIMATMASLSPEMRKEFQKSIGGDISAQQKLMMRMPSLMRDVTDESVSISETMANGKKDIDNYIKTYGKSYRLNAEGMREFGGGLRSAREEALQFGNFDERNAAAAKNATVTNQATDSLAEINLEQMNSRDALQSFVQLGVAPATRALAGLGKLGQGITGMLPGAGPAGENSLGNKLDRMNKAGPGATVPSGAGATTSGAAGPTSKEQQAYYDKMYNALLKSAKEQGLQNAEVIAKLGAAQTSLETGYGKHMVGNNAFGIKANKGEGGVGASTQEFINGKWVTINDKFRKYNNPEDSASDYIKFLKENKRYQGVLGATNINEAIAAQGRTGYATDPNYATKLAGITNKYESTIGSVKPADTMVNNAKPKEVKDLPTAGDKEHIDLLTAMLSHMETMSYASQKTAENTHKTAKNTQG